MLNERHQNILRATIKHYISTAEPVGSKTLLEEYNFKVSAATIRNTLGNLEKAGFLYQPHTSSGRVPSDSGYRIYVDSLITFNASISATIEKKFNQQLKWNSWNLEALFQRASHILANLSGCIALITLPQNTKSLLLHLQLVQVSSKQIIVVIVTDTYQAQSIFLETSFIFEEDEIQIISNFLNSNLRGKYLHELFDFDWSNIEKKYINYQEFVQALVKKIVDSTASLSNSQPIMVSGVSEVIRHPEFSELNQLQMLLYLLEEEPDQLLPLILNKQVDSSSRNVTIRIGAENPLEPMRSCAFISASYNQGEVPVGSVGVIGPTRILYENIVPLVETTADYISEALSSPSPFFS
jgi:heat-inducible transcriptional repressor